MLGFNAPWWAWMMFFIILGIQVLAGIFVHKIEQGGLLRTGVRCFIADVFLYSGSGGVLLRYYLGSLPNWYWGWRFKATFGFAPHDGDLHDIRHRDWVREELEHRALWAESWFKKQEMSRNAGLEDLEIEHLVRIFKDEFWKAHKIAQKCGFSVEFRMSHYYPKVPVVAGK